MPPGNTMLPRPGINNTKDGVGFGGGGGNGAKFSESIMRKNQLKGGQI